MALNLWLKVGSVLMMFTTLSKLLIGAGYGTDLPILPFVAAHAIFFYAIGMGIVIASWTKKVMVILLVIVAVFLGLAALGV